MPLQGPQGEQPSCPCGQRDAEPMAAMGQEATGTQLGPSALGLLRAAVTSGLDWGRACLRWPTLNGLPARAEHLPGQAAPRSSPPTLAAHRRLVHQSPLPQRPMAFTQLLLPWLFLQRLRQQRLKI